MRTPRLSLIDLSAAASWDGVALPGSLPRKVSGLEALGVKTGDLGLESLRLNA